MAQSDTRRLICLAGLKKVTNTSKKDSLSHGQGLYGGLPENKAGVLTTSPPHSCFTILVNPLNPRIKSHLLFAGIIRSSPFSPR